MCEWLNEYVSFFQQITRTMDVALEEYQLVSVCKQLP